MPFLERVEEARGILLHEVSVCRRCQELYDFGQHASPIIDKAADHFVCHVAGGSPQHLLELSRRETLDYHVLLRFFCLEFFQEVCLVVWALLIDLLAGNLLPLLQIDALQKSFAALFHFDQARLEALPQFVVLGSADVRSVPHIVLDELLNLVVPLRLDHALFDGLHCNHESLNVLNEDVVPSDEQLLSGRHADSRTLQVAVGHTVCCLHRCSLLEIGSLVALLHGLGASFGSRRLLQLLAGRL